MQVRVPIGDASNPRGFVEVTSENSFRAQALAATQQAFGIAALLALGVAVLLGVIMGRGISRPMISLTESARQMSEGDLGVRAEHNSRDEIGELAGQFNTMASRLQTSFDQLAAERDALRRFITDASHELRTPITALRNFNDLLQGPAADDLAARQEFLTESQVQIDRLAWFTKNLLDLSRLDGGISKLEMQTFEIDEIVEAAIAGIQAQAADREIQIERQLPSTPPIIYADRQRMQSALESLLDNAVKYSPPETSVTIGVEEDGDELLLWVADQGPGIAEHERERIFDRFYRGEAKKQPGYGLGLSIVKSIVDAHGGSVTVDSAFGGGARFTIHLPTSKQEPPKG
jgi:two-component system OmpR family sensor kinase